RAVEALDRRVPEVLQALAGDGLLFLTGDHGCDPTTPSTDHSRERTPCLVAGLAERPPVTFGDRRFSDLGATIARALGVRTDGLAGESFAADLGLG
ncbi:MAG TPA: phosphopentomutase, partial [Actinomycetota bacterium]|nr:phosphopentomutase [Actinomycetota bacterium]